MAPKAKAKGKSIADDELDAILGVTTDNTNNGSTAAQLKNKQKRDRQKAKKAKLEIGDGEVAVPEDSVPVNNAKQLPKSKAKAKPMSATAKLAAMQLQKVKEHEELLKKLEDEERRIEEAEAHAAEQERLAREAEQQRKEAERKIKEERRRQAEIEKKKANKAKMVDDRKKKKGAKKLPDYLVTKEETPIAEPAGNDTEELSPVTLSSEVTDGKVSDVVSTPDRLDWEAQLDHIKTVDVQVESREAEAVEMEVAEKSAEAPQDAVKRKAAEDALAAQRRKEMEELSQTEVDSKTWRRMAKDDVRRFFDFPSSLRAPICCILGHVDTGKTKILDRIRRSNVQEGEAGGITQQIGATFFPQNALIGQCRKVDPELRLELPGLLIIDTPGHESFNNLRQRGSSLCDIAILVADIMHGLEAQTRESINLLRARKCPFLIALNKIDRIYDWVPQEGKPFRETMGMQKGSCKEEFQSRLDQVLLELSEEGLNCSLYWENEDVKRNVSVVPTSAKTGEGLPDLLYLVSHLTQTIMAKSLQYKNEFECTVLEVKQIEGLGSTIDVILVQGKLREGDPIVVCGMTGPIVTTVRSLLTPQPLKEIRVRSEYVQHQEIRAAVGVKIAAMQLDDAVSGTSVFKIEPGDDVEDLKSRVMQDMSDIFNSVDKSGEGVYVVASTLGSLEALLQFLKDSKIPVFAVNLGTVHKIDIKKASLMHERGRAELACILAFDVKVTEEAEKEAEKLAVKIFKADIIYHLFDSFTKHQADHLAAKKESVKSSTVFPVIVSMLKDHCFHKTDPIIIGVKIEEGFLRIGTPLCAPGREDLLLGKVSSIEHNKKAVDRALKGDEVSIKIVGEPNVIFGRHFDDEDKLLSRITRESIDVLKEHFRDEMTQADWKLVVKLKKLLSIV